MTSSHFPGLKKYTTVIICMDLEDHGATQAAQELGALLPVVHSVLKTRATQRYLLVLAGSGLSGSVAALAMGVDELLDSARYLCGRAATFGGLTCWLLLPERTLGAAIKPLLAQLQDTPGYVQ